MAISESLLQTRHYHADICQWRFRWSRGKHAGLWYPSSRVQTRPKPLDFLGEEILSTLFFGGEVKPSVQCRKFTACKRTQKWHGSRHFLQNSRQFLAHISSFRCWGSLAWGTPGGGSWNILITGPPSWGFDMPLATALCKHSVKTFLLRILNAQGVAVPIEEEEGICQWNFWFHKM